MHCCCPQQGPLSGKWECLHRPPRQCSPAAVPRTLSYACCVWVGNAHHHHHHHHVTCTSAHPISMAPMYCHRMPISTVGSQNHSVNMAWDTMWNGGCYVEYSSCVSLPRNNPPCQQPGPAHASFRQWAAAGKAQHSNFQLSQQPPLPYSAKLTPKYQWSINSCVQVNSGQCLHEILLHARAVPALCAVVSAHISMHCCSQQSTPNTDLGATTVSCWTTVSDSSRAAECN